MKSLVLLLVATTGCADPCVDGVCSNEGYARPQPGPCQSAHADGSFHNHCTYTYDVAKLTQVSCTWSDSDPDRHGIDTATYSYDASGAVASIHSVRTADDEHRDTTWMFDAMHAIRTEVEQFQNTSTSTEIDTYDRTTFQFLPDSLGDWVWPTAELGLQTRREIDPANGLDTTEHVTWTRDGNTLTRDHVTYELDDQGRLIKLTGAETPGFLPHVWTYSYRGDRLVKYTLSTDSSNGEPMPTSYHYDKGTNLSNITSDDHGDDAYDYSCW